MLASQGLLWLTAKKPMEKSLKLTDYILEEIQELGIRMPESLEKGGS